MKSSQFKRNAAAIRFRREETQKKKVAWGKIVYLGLFYALILWLIVFFGARFIMIERMGQIDFPKTEVTLVEAGYLQELYVKEGDEIQKDAPLFKIRYEREAKQSERNWVTRELWDMDQKVRTSRARLRSTESRLETRRREVKRIEESALLELRDPGRAEDLRLEIEELKMEAALERETLAELRRVRKDIQAIPVVVEEPMLKMSEVFRAPMSGTITRVAKSESEVVFPGEIVVNIHRQEKVTVRAFFEQDDADALQVGDSVQIILPSKRKAQGIITRFYFATYPLPPEFQPRFEPRQRSIVVDIQPIFFDDIPTEDYFYKMGVRIRKFRDGFGWLGL